MDFRVELEVFRGPLDLLLYLVRKHEVEITEIPIAPITEQFVSYLEVMQHLNVDEAGDFLEMASTLIEIKSRMLLPRADEVNDPLEDPRHDLVQKLLEYKKFKDAASLLEDRGREWQQRFPRLGVDLHERSRDPADEPIHEVELWDLVSAFGRILRDSSAVQPSNILYDDTPIHVYMSRIHERLKTEGRLRFSDLLLPTMHRSTLIGIFLAVLELVRHHGVLVEQDETFADFWIAPGETSDETAADYTQADEYEHGGGEAL
ncbi:MAG: segregation/condensation protein A [Planctomycetota bacterium]|nr:segregation/condensation protein A [Planctomycetota bacterium]